jgi:hypothetical protein
LIPSQAIAEDGVVEAQELIGLRIAQALDERGGALHVGHEDDVKGLSPRWGGVYPRRLASTSDGGECRGGRRPTLGRELRDEPVLKRVGRGSGAAVDPYFVEKVPYVTGDGRGAQDKSVRDLLVGAALGDLEQDLYLSLAEMSWICGARPRGCGYSCLQRLSELGCASGEGFHAQLVEERASLSHQLHSPAAVALPTSGD